MDTNLPSILKSKRREFGMGIIEFANYIGMHRSWVSNKEHGDIDSRPLAEITMIKLHDKLDISYDIMEAYNQSVVEKRGN